MTQDVLSEISKDDLVLSNAAALGGESTEVNERDLFLACWHAFPATMRWVDTALPNPDTFTASLRRLDQRDYIVRIGKQKRQKRRRRPSTRRTILDAPGKAGVVKARIAEGGLAAAGLEAATVAAVARLLPDQGSKEIADPTPSQFASEFARRAASASMRAGWWSSPSTGFPITSPTPSGPSSQISNGYARQCKRRARRV